MKSGGFHVCVGALYPPFMEYIDVIVENFKKSIGNQGQNSAELPSELVERAKEMSESFRARQCAETVKLLTAFATAAQPT